MFAGWITFSAFDEDGATAAQAQVLMRAQDPLTELGLTLGGHRKEDASGRRRCGRSRGGSTSRREPVTTVVCVERRRQWSRVGQRAPLGAFRSGLHTATAPFRKRAAVSVLVVAHAIVVGSGPNGLAAAIALARAGVSVRGARARGDDRRRHAHGGADAAGFRTTSARRSIRSRVASPFLQTLPLDRARARVDPPAGARSRTRSTTARRRCSSAPSTATGATLGRRRAGATARSFGPLARDADVAARRPARPAARAAPSARAGALRPAAAAGRRARSRARASAASARGRFFAGLRGALDAAARRARRRPRFGLVLALLGARGRLAARARRLAAARRRARVVPALARRRRSRPGTRSSRSPSCRRAAPCCSTSTPRQLLRLAGPRLPGALPPRRSSASATARASSSSTGRSTAPIPWRAPECARRRDRPPRRDARGDRGVRARAVARRRSPTRPFVLLAQPSLFDPTRAPAGRHTALGLLPRAERLDAST